MTSAHKKARDWAKALELHTAYNIGRLAAEDLEVGEIFVGAMPAATMQFPGPDNADRRKAFVAGYLSIIKTVVIDEDSGIIQEIL